METPKIAAVTIVILAACSSGPETVISPRARPLTDDVAKRAVIYPDRLAFPVEGNADLMALTDGDIVVSGWQDGFLRRVTAVSDDGQQHVVITTTAATLTDVVVEGETHTSIDMTTEAAHWPGARRALGIFDGFEVNLDGKTLYTDPAIGLAVRVTKGSLVFSPTLDLGIAIKGGQLTFRAVETGVITTDLHVEAICSQALDKDVEVTLFESPPFSIPLPAIGPIPITVTGKLQVKAGVHISAKEQVSAAAGATASATLTIGVTYADDEFQPVHDFTTTWTHDGPRVGADASLHFLGYLSGGLELGFFGGLDLGLVKVGAGGNVGVSAQPYLQLDYDTATPDQWALRAGVRGRYWGTLTVLGSKVAGISEPGSPLFDESTQIAPADPSATLPVDAGTCTDQIWNGLESGVDCGGSCPPCTNGGFCLDDADCESNFCLGSKCAPPLGGNCFNGVRDGDETQIDCGGSCLACTGDACSIDADCASGSCGYILPVCMPPAQCYDGQFDGTESDIDCGGACAPTQKCPNQASCYVNSDCESGLCASGQFCAPVPQNCSDGVLDGDELETDCGGSCPFVCP